MNVNLFIARRIYYTLRRDGKEKFHPSVSIALWGIILGTVVMLLSVSIVIGFKNEIKERVIGFGSHLQIVAHSNNYSYEPTPMIFTKELEEHIKGIDNVSMLQLFSTKPTIIKTDSLVEPMILKGVDKDYDLSFFAKNLVDGEIPNFSSPSNSKDKILISKKLSQKIHTKVGDKLLCYFFQEQIKVRKLIIVGIYSTGFAEYDNLFAIGSLSLLQSLNEWEEEKVGGAEIYLKNFSKLDSTLQNIQFELLMRRNAEGAPLYDVHSVKELFPQIFSWLAVLDTNVWIILLLMTLISGFTMISGLLIIILEQVNMIGILKAMGSSNRSIRRIFLYVSSFLVCRGIFWGDMIGIGLIFLQRYTHFLTLNPEIYYIPFVPMECNFWYILLLNFSTLLVVMLMLILPSHIIAHIQPSKTIRCE